MAIVCQTGGNAGPEDDPRRRTETAPLRTISSPVWVISAIIIVVVLVGVLAYMNRPGEEAGAGGQPNADPDKPVARIALGMPIRDAVLALEPEPDPKRRVTLHDLLGPNAPKSGHFTYSDGRRTTTVRFRDGKVTSVNEMAINYPPGMAGYIPETAHVTISADDDEAPGPGEEAP